MQRKPTVVRLFGIALALVLMAASLTSLYWAMRATDSGNADRMGALSGMLVLSALLIFTLSKFVYCYEYSGTVKLIETKFMEESGCITLLAADEDDFGPTLVRVVTFEDDFSAIFREGYFRLDIAVGRPLILRWYGFRAPRSGSECASVHLV